MCRGLGHGRAAQATPINIDQSNSIGGGGTGGLGIQVLTIGQTFTPALSSIDAAEFSLRSAGSSDVTVNLYAGSGYGGSLLGTSAMTVTASTFTTHHFDFGSSIVLVPSSTYTLQMVFTFGGNDLFAEYAESDVYGGGGIVEAPGFDLVFAEGAHVPEPSSLALLGLAVVFGVSGARRRRYRSRGASKPNQNLGASGHSFACEVL